VNHLTSDVVLIDGVFIKTMIIGQLQKIRRIGG
jgi:hypothetical protein